MNNDGDERLEQTVTFHSRKKKVDSNIHVVLLRKWTCVNNKSWYEGSKEEWGKFIHNKCNNDYNAQDADYE